MNSSEWLEGCLAKAETIGYVNILSRRSFASCPPSLQDRVVNAHLHVVECSTCYDLVLKGVDRLAEFPDPLTRVGLFGANFNYLHDNLLAYIAPGISFYKMRA